MAIGDKRVDLALNVSTTQPIIYGELKDREGNPGK
jgi:hypothetical protein